jgi:hypothetical protein
MPPTRAGSGFIGRGSGSSPGVRRAASVAAGSFCVLVAAGCGAATRITTTATTTATQTQTVTRTVTAHASPTATPDERDRLVDPGAPE